MLILVIGTILTAKECVYLNNFDDSRKEMNEEDITLKKGDNTFYLTGNGAHCKIILQIDGINEDNIIYSGTVN